MSSLNRQIPLRPRYSVWLWLAIMLPVFFGVGSALYFSAWTSRSTEIAHEVYCAIHDGGYEVAEDPDIGFEQAGLGYALVFRNVYAVSSSLREKVDETTAPTSTPNATATFAEVPPADSPTLTTTTERTVLPCPGPTRESTTSEAETEVNETQYLPASCRQREISRISFFPPNVSQSSTYESIARAIEGCAGRDDLGQATRLCTGTRDEAQRDLCAVSRNLTGALYDYDLTTSGMVSKWLGILASVQFGLFQLFAVVIAVVGIYRVRHLVADLGGNGDRRKERTIASINETIKIAIEGTAGKPDKASRYRGRMRDFRDEAAKLVSEHKEWSGTIVQLGLLGTLTGMVLLFASLERGESADALTAQLALSEMLGSLGLAFGTTIFAIIVSMVYTRQIDQDTMTVMTRIRHETDRGELELQEEELPTPETETPDFNLFDLGSKWVGSRVPSTEAQLRETQDNTRYRRWWLLGVAAITLAILLLTLSSIVLGVVTFGGELGG
ncbi:MotA/TolQ/ExbB proton channel family protein [Fluviibacterium sp. S390]|uniref:MotA/TolQ/ExbB proton channel family protein n=1 Tax=Fluviibacterium sp. S390 TaxID=3415139 RepID=UPI003C7A7A7B